MARWYGEHIHPRRSDLGLVVESREPGLAVLQRPRRAWRKDKDASGVVPLASSLLHYPPLPYWTGGGEWASDLYAGPAGFMCSATISATSLTSIEPPSAVAASTIIVMQNGQPTASVDAPVAFASA